MFADTTKEVLETCAAITESGRGKDFIAFLKKSFDETANDVIRREDIRQIYMQHGFMQCCSLLILLLGTAHEELKRGDDGQPDPVHDFPTGQERGGPAT